MNEYTRALRNFMNFSGRSRRREYWMFWLVNIVIMFVLSFVDYLINIMFNVPNSNIYFVSTIYSLFIFIPYLALLVRRLHDTNRSAWWLLLMLLPIIGQFIIIIFTLMDSKPGTNRWGASPKYGA